MSGFSDYDRYDGLGLAELVRKQEVTPRELVEEAISRIEQLNPQLNAVIHKMYDAARQAAEGNLPEGSFRGVPFMLKDLLAPDAGVPMRLGSRFHRDFVPDHDSEMVRRFKAAGVMPYYVFGEAGAVHISPEGWMNPNAGWKDACRNFDHYVEQIKELERRMAEWNAANGGRALGFTLFTLMGSQWESFNLDGYLARLAGALA